MPRRVVTYPTHLQGLNDWVSISAFVIGLSMLVFLFNVVWSLLIKREPAEPNPWHFEVARVAAADAGAGARLRPDPGVRRRPVPVRSRAGPAGRRRSPRPAGAHNAMEASASAPAPSHRARAARVAAPRDLGRRAGCCAARLVLLRLVPVRLLLPARAGHQQRLEDRQRRPRRWASAWRSWRCSCSAP